jgi:hypothetical protein
MGKIYILKYRLIRGIHEIRRSGGLRCHHIRTKFHMFIFDIQTVMGGIDGHKVSISGPC